MHDANFKSWRQESDAIEQEMDRLIKSPLSASAEERRIRRIQFAALLERREDAARNLIKMDLVHLRNSGRGLRSLPGEYFLSTRDVSSTGDPPFEMLPDGRSTGDHNEACSASAAIAANSSTGASEEVIGTGAQSSSADASLDRPDGSEPARLPNAAAPGTTGSPSKPRFPESPPASEASTVNKERRPAAIQGPRVALKAEYRLWPTNQALPAANRSFFWKA